MGEALANFAIALFTITAVFAFMVGIPLVLSYYCGLDSAIAEYTLEETKQRWHRLVYETPSWAWRQDPYLEGMTQHEHDWLYAQQKEPTEPYRALKG